jgi:hypothetical protein
MDFAQPCGAKGLAAIESQIKASFAPTAPSNSAAHASRHLALAGRGPPRKAPQPAYPSPAPSLFLNQLPQLLRSLPSSQQIVLAQARFEDADVLLRIFIAPGRQTPPRVGLNVTLKGVRP